MKHCANLKSFVVFRNNLITYQKRMPMLRDYQLRGFNEIFQGWEVEDIIMFCLATGGGKTVTFTEAIKAILHMGKTVTLVAHREELIAQAWTHLYKNGIVAGLIKAGCKPQPHLPCQ